MIERKTRQRESILETFRESAGPLTPNEVLDLTKQRIPDLGIATVYRNIKSFVESGLLLPVPVPGEPDRYEMEGCPGSLSALAPDGFKVETHEIFLYGRCRDCVAKT